MANSEDTALKTAATPPIDGIDALVEGRCSDPFALLGPHATTVDGADVLSVRAFIPHASEVALVETHRNGSTTAMNRIHDGGFFESQVGPVGNDFRYRFSVKDHAGHSWEAEDPYRFGRVLTDYDLHLLAEGSHYRNYDKLGAHPMELDGVAGVHFAVWAPNAERVSVVGEFNSWDGRRHPMRQLAPSGLWEVFLPDLAIGDLYKFEIRSRHGGEIHLRSDPYGFSAERRPKTASVVFDIPTNSWSDQSWIAEGRARRNAFDAPISIYEVHLGSWRRGDRNRYLSYDDLIVELIPYVKDMGFTHIELLPILEHPFDGSWGYQALGYFAPTSRFGSPESFIRFINACHEADLGVILDWVPAHFPRDSHGLRQFDGTHLYEHADPRQGEHRDWGTLIFNYGRDEVRNFLIGNALFWLDKYHLDGFRVDAVASMLYLDYSREENDWIPNRFGGRENLEAIEFLKKFNELCHQEHPGVLTIAEESTAWPGVTRPTFADGLGFSFKWNMGWMNDTLDYFSRDPVHRKHHHQSLTFGMLYSFTENFLLPLSHDEVVHGKKSLLDKMPGDDWQKFANLRVLYGLQFMMPGKKLLFMGSEFGQRGEWNCENSLDWHLLDTDSHRGIQRFVKDLSALYKSEKSLHEVDFRWNGFDWLDVQDWEKSILSWVRRANDPEDEVIVILNLTPEPRQHYRLGVPRPGYYREILNSDSEHYGGSNLGNGGGLETLAVPTHAHGQCLELMLPPLSCLVLKRME